MLRDGQQLTVMIAGMPPALGKAQIAALVDGENHFIVSLDQEGCDLIFAGRVRGERFGLSGPTMRIGSACAGASDTVLAAGVLSGRQIDLAVTSPSQKRRRSLTITPGLGWILLSPFPGLTRFAGLATGLWFLFCGPHSPSGQTNAARGHVGELRCWSYSLAESSSALLPQLSAELILHYLSGCLSHRARSLVWGCRDRDLHSTVKHGRSGMQQSQEVIRALLQSSDDDNYWTGTSATKTSVRGPLFMLESNMTSLPSTLRVARGSDQ